MNERLIPVDLATADAGLDDELRRWHARESVPLGLDDDGEQRWESRFAYKRQELTTGSIEFVLWEGWEQSHQWHLESASGRIVLLRVSPAECMVRWEGRQLQAMADAAGGALRPGQVVAWLASGAGDAIDMEGEHMAGRHSKEKPIDWSRLRTLESGPSASIMSVDGQLFITKRIGAEDAELIGERLTASSAYTGRLTRAEKIRGVDAWDAMAKEDRLELDDWLRQRYGTNPDGSPIVAVATFHGWRRFKKLRPD